MKFYGLSGLFWGGLVMCGIVATVSAHQCGPPTIAIEVGQTCPWRIRADLTEVKTIYSPALTGDIDAVRVTPGGNRPFAGIHGDFTFTGLKSGTAVLTVNWHYPATGASGICTVEITVTEPPPGTVREIGQGRMSTLSTFVSIPAEMLARMIQLHVPAESKKLLIFAQCYGGSMAVDPALQLPNTSILSATMPGVEAVYGGYHDDAARNLKPEEGRTALDLHEIASSGRQALPGHVGEQVDPNAMDCQDPALAYQTEWPTISGTLPPSDFSLASTSPDGEVQSRHIVFYAGAPDTKFPRLVNLDGVTVPNWDHGTRTTITDAADRDAVKQNFQGQHATTVRTVGGDRGAPGWDLPGSQEGLLNAIREAGLAIGNSPNPDKEQFILFVGDHGVEGSRTFPATPVMIAGTGASSPQQHRVQQSSTVTLHGLPPFAHPENVANQIRDHADANPGIVLFLTGLPANLSRDAEGHFEKVLAPDAVRLKVAPEGEEDWVPLSVFHEQAYDLDGDTILGSIEGEGLELFFPVSPYDLLGRWLGKPLSVIIINNSADDIVLSRAARITGPIPRYSPFDPSVPARIMEFRLLSDNRPELVLRGARGSHYIIEISNDLQTWADWREVSMTRETQTVTGLAPATAWPIYLRAKLP